MGDRKYRQRGYQDSDSARSAKRAGERPQPKTETFGPKTPQMPGTRTVSRCAGCGHVLSVDFNPLGRCPQCGFELHSCKQCGHFDPASRFECTQPIPARVARKDARNDCGFYAPRVTIERQTSPGSSRPDDPRQAFENLFKK